MIQSRCDQGAEWLVANTKSWSATAPHFVLKTHTSPVHEAASPFAIKPSGRELAVCPTGEGAIFTWMVNGGFHLQGCQKNVKMAFADADSR